MVIYWWIATALRCSTELVFGDYSFFIVEQYLVSASMMLNLRRKRMTVDGVLRMCNTSCWTRLIVSSWVTKSPKKLQQDLNVAHVHSWRRFGVDCVCDGWVFCNGYNK